MVKLAHLTRREKIVYIGTFSSVLFYLVIRVIGYSDAFLGTTSKCIIAIFVLLLLLMLNEKREEGPTKKAVLKGCYFILIICYILSQVFPDGLLFQITLIAGILTAATLSITLLIKEEEA